ncbi:MAG TPA: HNH endonuclease [Jatrophihabitantaceae bacterium]
MSERQFRALPLRDGGCTHRGCGSTQGLEAHHLRHWIHGGRTDLTNLASR